MCQLLISNITSIIFYHCRKNSIVGLNQFHTNGADLYSAFCMYLSLLPNTPEIF